MKNPFGNTYSHYDMLLYIFSLLLKYQTKLWHHDPQLTCLQNITRRHKIYCISFEAQDSASVHHLERQVHLIINFSSLSWQQGIYPGIQARSKAEDLNFWHLLRTTSPKGFENNGTFLYTRRIYLFLIFFLKHSYLEQNLYLSALLWFHHFPTWKLAVYKIKSS